MTRDQAIDRVRKLRELTEERGATPAEAATARERADRLVQRFELQAHELVPVQPARPVQPAQPPPQAPPMPGPGWWMLVNGQWVPFRPMFAPPPSYATNTFTFTFGQ